jgi:hypothetical protein
MTASTGYTYPSPQHIINENIRYSLTILDNTVSLCISYKNSVVQTDKQNHTDLIYWFAFHTTIDIYMSKGYFIIV